MKPSCITGDIQKAFLQIKVEPQDRDVLRLVWYNNLAERKIVECRFTRVIFGSGPSPYILGATLQKHISQYEERFPKSTKDLLENTYVDDVQSGGETTEELLEFQSESTEIMREGGFVLHKWHSHDPAVEEHIEDIVPAAESDKQVLQTKILGNPWNKENDELSVYLSKA